jgi:hypothetical protein|tara:strand:+ start:1375 stop:1647 length:273 start_codon:yes stop_codon:yes gene_type:complete
MAMVQPTDAQLEASFPPEGSGIAASDWSKASRDERAAMLMRGSRPTEAATAPTVEAEAQKPTAAVQAPPDPQKMINRLLAQAGGLGTPFT